MKNLGIVGSCGSCGLLPSSLRSSWGSARRRRRHRQRPRRDPCPPRL